MTTAQMDKLLKAVEQLTSAELEQFVSHVTALQVQRRASVLPRAESELLMKINKGFSAEFYERFRELFAKREEETLTPEEHKEYIDMTEQMEYQNAERLGYLVELARLRGTTLTDLMDSLDIKPFEP